MEEKDSLRKINVYKEGSDIVENYFRHDYSIHVCLVNKDIYDVAVGKNNNLLSEDKEEKKNNNTNNDGINGDGQEEVDNNNVWNIFYIKLI